MNHETPASTLRRRNFVQAMGAVAAAPLVLGSEQAFAAGQKSRIAETLVTELFSTLTDKQRETICLPFDHPLRDKVSANWHITDPILSDDFYTAAQRDLNEQIVRSISSEAGYQNLMRQMEDDSAGIGDFSVAIFGEPGTGKFQWELTGRHLTLRADGDSVENTAFGGPIVYGHSEEQPKKNVYYYQTLKANEVFNALDSDQAKQALIKRAPKETDIDIRGANAKLPGIAGKSLSSDQLELVQETLQVLMGPFREKDSAEVMQLLKEGGGLDQLHMAFYQQGDIDDDRVWDIWRVEGPSFVWHFRGAPHVHAYVNIGMKKA